MAEPRPLLDRLLNTPDIAKIVPKLQPEVLHRVIRRCGLEACGEFVALATTEQLSRVLDLDVWRAPAPGVDEEFDAGRFGEWIAVLTETSPAVAAEKLVGLDPELVVAGLARHVAVFEYAAVAPYTTIDGQQISGRALDADLIAHIGGYVIQARRRAVWEPIAELLAILDAEYPDDFRLLMRGCVRLSNGPCEADGSHDLLQDEDQHTFDLAAAREERRTQQGFVTPAQAHAFLHGGRTLPLDGGRPDASPIARAYFRQFEATAAADPPNAREAGDLAREPTIAPGPAETNPMTRVVEILRDAGMLAAPPRALLSRRDGPGDDQMSRLSLVRGHVAAHPTSVEELAYLANAMVAGCSLQSRPFTGQEASDAAAAICNLGLENWPSHWSGCDLVTAFQVGYAVLHRDVCLYTADRLIDVLSEMRCADRDIQLRLNGLRTELLRALRDGEPWHVRNDLDVLLTLDAPSWAAALGLIAECPVMHAAVSLRRAMLAINPTEFEWISQNSQIAAIRGFLASLRSRLTD